jgi:tetratricopeptide (TPR) repeat protein
MDRDRLPAVDFARDLLVGRRRERERIELLLDQARSGKSSTLLIEGEPGIGKTALLGHALDRASGLTVITARGIETESNIAFAGLLELLQPLHTMMRELPRSQRSALSAALAMRNDVVPDPFAVYVATLTLLAAAADRRGMLAAVDDAHCLDTSSLQALVFVARRLRSEGIVLLLCSRPDETRPELQASDLPRLTLRGLDRASSHTLLALSSRERVTARVADRLFEATGGNPLALIESCSQLRPTQLAGVEPLDDPIPVGSNLERAFLRSIDRLPPETRQGLVVLAAMDARDTDVVARALGSVGLSLEHLTAAESAGILSGRPLEFRHPLLRGAIYHGATSDLRRAAHRAVADALTEAGAEDRRAWHLARATPSADESVARVVEEAAARARARGSYESAAIAQEEAARLSGDDARRGRRFIVAARDWYTHGNCERAEALLDRASSLTSDPIARADITQIRARVRTWSGRVTEARDILVAESVRIEALHIAKATMMAVEAVGPSLMSGNLREAVSTARRAHKLSERLGRPAEISATVMLVIALIGNGRARQAESLLSRAESLVNDADCLTIGHGVCVGLAHALMWLGEYERARRLLTRVIGHARERSALAALPFALGVLSEIDLRTDRWSSAYANASEGLQLARDTGQVNQSGFNLVCLARVEAALGLEYECRRHVAAAEEIERRFGGQTLRLYAASVLGFLELSLGRPREAVDVLEPLRDFTEKTGLLEPSIAQWQPDLIEAYARSGYRAEAATVLDVFAIAAKNGRRGWAHAASGRCRGILATEERFEAEFAAALHRYDGRMSRFERARTQLCFGERLRRANTNKKRKAGRALEASLGIAAVSDTELLSQRAAVVEEVL